MAPPGEVDQLRYRWRNDDGTEITATWKADANTLINYNVQLGKLRLRFGIQDFAFGVNANKYQLQFDVDAAGLWADVNSVSAIVSCTPSTFLVNGSNTTQQLTAGTFITPNQGVNTSDGVAGTVNFTTSPEVCELEYCIIIDPLAVLEGQKLDFKLVYSPSGLDLEKYSVASAELQVLNPANQDSLSQRRLGYGT